MQVEHCLQNLKKIATSYTQQTNDTSLEESVLRCEQAWESTVQRVEHFRQQLQRIPAKWDAYKEKFREMERWMDHVDQTMDSIVREVDSAEAFEREKTIFQVSDSDILFFISEIVSEKVHSNVLFFHCFLWIQIVKGTNGKYCF